MQYWPIKEPRGYGFAEVQEYCVRDAAWQRHRLLMKGISTAKKLDMCMEWYLSHSLKISHSTDGGITTYHLSDIEYRARVQIGNYLGALRRGGQLDLQNRVQR